MRHRWSKADARALQRFMEQQAIREQIARSLGCHPDDIEITDEEEADPAWWLWTWGQLALTVIAAACGAWAAWRVTR